MKMANREENLKKINAKLEKMSDEELEQVAGGYVGETAGDSKFLYSYGLMDDYHNVPHTIAHWKSDSAAVDSGWSKAGITCVTKLFAWQDNQYFLNGKEISRDEAHKIVEEKFQKIR